MSTPAYSLFHFKDGAPAAPTGFRNVKWQKSAPYLDTVVVNNQTVTAEAIDISSYEPNLGGVNIQSGTSYTLQASDAGKLVVFTNAAAVAVTADSTLGGAFGTGTAGTFLCGVIFLGAAGGTVTPSSGTINGTALLTLAQNGSALLFFNGTNWWAMEGASTGGGGGSLNGAVVKTGDYTITGGDNGKLIILNSAVAHTFTLPNPPPSATFVVFVASIGVGILTVSRNTLTIDNVAGDLTITQFRGCSVWTDSSNYFTERGMTIIGGKSIDDGSAPTDGQILQYSSFTGKWEMLVDRPIFPVSAVVGKPSAGQLVCIYTAAAAMTFPANFASPNSYGSLGTLPTATATYSIYKNGTLVGNVVVSTGGVFTFTTVGGVSFNLAAGDRLTMVAPGSQDATMADVGITLVGTRTATVPAVLSQGIFLWRGTYSGATAYSINDVVAYTVSGKVQTYICILGTTGNAPTNTTYWNLVAQAGGDGTTSAGQIQDESFIYAVDAGSANAFSVTLSPAPNVVDGSVVVFRAANATTGASTLTLPGDTGATGGTAQSIVKSGGTALTTGDVNANQVVMAVWDNTHTKWEIVGGGGGGDVTAKYIIGDFDAILTNSVKISGLYQSVDVCPASPNTMNDEFDDTSGNSGTGNGLNGRWAWFNQGSTGITYSNSCAVIDCVSNGGSDSARFIGQVLPSAPWEFLARFTAHEPANGAWAANYHFPGMFLWETSSSKFLSFGVQANGGWGLRVRGNATEPIDINYSYAGQPHYIKIGRVSTTLTFYFSGDGIVFNSIGTRTITNDFTTAPDRVGVGVNPYSQRSVLVCDFFRRTV